MGTHYLPREYKGEARILNIFSLKSLVTTAGGAAIGYGIHIMLSTLGIKKTFLACTLIFGAIGYGIGALKMPNSNNFELTRKTGGENISDILIRWFKFKMKHGKIYIYKERIYTEIKEGGTKDGHI